MKFHVSISKMSQFWFSECLICCGGGGEQSVAALALVGKQQILASNSEMEQKY